MIDELRKVIFIHIVKTGGESIEHAFGINMNKENGIGKVFKHASLDQMLANNLLKESLNKYYVFTVVRNPYSLLQSFYNFHRYKLPKIMHKKFLNLENSFEGFVHNLDRYFDSSHNDKLNKMNGAHMLNEIKYSRLIDHRVHMILRFENLGADYSLLREQLSMRISKSNKTELNLPQKLPHLNAGSAPKDRVDYLYNSEMKKIVQFHFREEIERFQYRA